MRAREGTTPPPERGKGVAAEPKGRRIEERFCFAFSFFTFFGRRECFSAAAAAVGYVESQEKRGRKKKKKK